MPEATPREREFLALLFASEGRPVALSELVKALTGKNSVRGQRLARVIASRVRGKFPEMKIETVPGGYVVNARACPHCAGSGFFVPTFDDLAAEIEGKVAR